MTLDQALQLSAPFPFAAVRWRLTDFNAETMQGRAVPYIDARDVQNRLDEVVGVANWKVEFKASPFGSATGAVCAVSVRVGSEWVSKEDGAQLDSFGGQSANKREMAIKGAYSDSFKRAAVMWGIGRYLYSFDGAFVTVKNALTREFDTPKFPASLLLPSESALARPMDFVPEARRFPVAVEGARGRSENAANEENSDDLPIAGTRTVTPAEPERVAEPRDEVVTSAASRETPVEQAAQVEPSAAASAAAAVSDAAPTAKPVAQSVKAVEAPARVAAVATAPVIVPPAAKTEADADAPFVLTDEIIEGIDASLRNYVIQLRRYADEGKNLATLKDALERGKAKEKLSTTYPKVLAALLAIVVAKLAPSEEKAAA